MLKKTKKSGTICDFSKIAATLDAIVKNSNQTIIFMNDRFEVEYYSCNIPGKKDLPYGKSMGIGEDITKYILPSDMLLFDKTIKKAFKGSNQLFKQHYTNKAGDRASYEVRLSPVKNQKKIEHVCISIHYPDLVLKRKVILTESKGIETLLGEPKRTSEFKLQYPYGDVYWAPDTVDVLGLDLYRNPINIYELLHFVHPMDKNKLISRIEESLASENRFQVVFRFIVDENIKYIQMSSNIIRNRATGKNYIQGTITDITESKVAEEKVRTILVENEILLKEIQHRVKNNFQVMLSLLSLQARHIQDPQYQDIFRVSQNRIKTLALVYEKLYYSKDFSSINFSEYVQQLIKNIVYVYSVNPLKISIKLNIETLFLELDQAVPCGLIINELVSNSIKFAFPEDRSGEITVDLSQKGNNLELKVTDNGIGIPINIDYKSTETLGLQLVMTLTAQMDGLINYDGSNGSAFSIVIPMGTGEVNERLKGLT